MPFPVLKYLNKRLKDELHLKKVRDPDFGTLFVEHFDNKVEYRAIAFSYRKFGQTKFLFEVGVRLIAIEEVYDRYQRFKMKEAGFKRTTSPSFYDILVAPRAGF